MRSTALLALLAVLALSPMAGADMLKLDLGVGPAPNGPPRGSTMTDVQTRFGAPQSQTGPIGEPPITVWHYSDMNMKVYFEHDRVLHSTTRTRPPAPTG